MRESLLQHEKWLIIGVLLARSPMAQLITIYPARLHTGME